jgi:hypothetical protein
VSLAHQRNPELTLEQVQRRERESLVKRLHHYRRLRRLAHRREALQQLRCGGNNGAG